MEKFNIREIEVSDALYMCLNEADEDHYEIKDNWFLKFNEGDDFLQNCVSLERKADEDFEEDEEDYEEEYNLHKDFYFSDYADIIPDFLQSDVFSDIVNDIMQYLEEYYKN